MALLCLLLMVVVPSWVAGQGSFPDVDLIEPEISDNSTYLACTCPSSSFSNCVCVNFESCGRDNIIVTHGSIFVELRFGETDHCSRPEVCCQIPKDVVAGFKKGECGKLPTGAMRPSTLRASAAAVLPGDVPWLLALMIQPGYFRCVATLLGPTVALTAAHCVTGHNMWDLFLTTPLWPAGESSHSPQNRTISQILIYPNYNNVTRGGDIALLIMNQPMNANSEVGAACLPDPGTVYDGQNCVVAGWGKEKGLEVDMATRMELPVVSRTECQRRLRFTKLNRYFILAEGSICAGGRHEGLDACAGDGGGPLACPQDGRFYVAGAVSWGVKCGMRGIPGVYGDVAGASRWIRSKLQEENVLEYAVPTGER